MNFFKRYIAILTVFCLIFGLAACAPEEINARTNKPSAPTGSLAAPTSNPTQNVSVDDNPANNDDGSSIETTLRNTPTHISKNISDNFSIEAEVRVPNVKKADILFAKFMQLNEQEQVLLSMFFKDKTPEKELFPADNAVTYSDEKSLLTISNSYIYYRLNDFDYYKYPTENFPSESDMFSAYPRLNEVYTQEHLDFATKEEAIQQAEKIFKQLSIETDSNVEIYAIDHKTMQEQQAARIKKEKAYTNDPTDGYKYKTNFTTDDDFYMMYFSMTQNGIPITRQSYIPATTERSLNGSTARVCYSNKGILELNPQSIYEQQGVAESPTKLIAVEDAINIAHEKGNAIITSDKTTISAIDFEYVPVPYNSNYNEVKLVPCWCLTETQLSKNGKPSKDQKDESSTHSTMIFINAVTGEVIR